MGFVTSGERAALDKVAEIESEIRDFVRQQNDSALDGHRVADQLGFLIGRVAGTSIEEIDSATAGLQALRGELQERVDHVQREVAAYAILSQTTMESTRIIADKLSQWKAPADEGASETTAGDPDVPAGSSLA